MYVNVGPMNARLNGQPLVEVIYFKYLRSPMEAGGGCERDVVHRMNEGYKALGALKSVRCNRGLGLNAKRSI